MIWSKLFASFLVLAFLVAASVGCILRAPEVTSEPTPAPASTPDEGVELKLVATAPSSYQLDVAPVYVGRGLCMLGSLTMLLKYDAPSLDFCDTIAYSGIGPSGYREQKEPTGIKFHYPQGGLWAGMVLAPRNLGYSLICGVAKGGRIDGPSFPLQQWPRIQSEAKSIKYFDNEEYAFDFLKKVIASDYPVAVHLNVVLVMNDFAKVSNKWVDFSRGCTEAKITEVSHMMVVTGYDTTHVYLNDPGDPAKPTKLPTTIDNFKSAWNVQETRPPSLKVGPYWMLFIQKSSEMKSVSDILAWNKQRSVNTPSEIRLFSENPPRGFTNRQEERDIQVIAKVRLEYAKFLEKNGKKEAAAHYEQSSKLWEGLLKSSTISEDLKKIADLEEQAQSLY